LIVSAVKICKQCLQTASASEGLSPRPLPRLRPQDSLSYSPKMKIPGASPARRFIQPMDIFCAI